MIQTSPRKCSCSIILIRDALRSRNISITGGNPRFLYFVMGSCHQIDDTHLHQDTSNQGPLEVVEVMVVKEEVVKACSMR